MTRIAVVSSIYGRYDEPIPQPVQDMDCDWVMVSDRDGAPPPWKVIVEPRPQLHARLAAKVAKCRPDLYADADVYIWIDGNLAVQSTDFVSWCVSTLDGGLLAQHECDGRSSLVGEADIAASMPKYGGLPVRAQARSYVDAGYPDDWGLWATGLMVRSAKCPDFGSPWLAEMVRWTYEDQVSEPPILHKLGLRPIDLGVNWSDPGRFRLRSHRDSW